MKSMSGNVGGRRAHGRKDASLPFSNAVRVGPVVAVAGQGGLDPVSGKRVDGGIVSELRQIKKNIVNALAECECTLDDVVRVDIFLADLQDYDRLNSEYKAWFSEPPPARTTVRADLLYDLRVEVTVLAIASAGKYSKG